jgi:xanthine/CO dehydrogenase XdhC/CoxF family maturation factor
MLAFTADEEGGLVGAEALAQRRTDIAFAVALDLVGGSGELVLNGASTLIGAAEMQWLADAADRAGMIVRAPLPHRVVSRWWPQAERADHGAFTRRGIRAFHLYNRGNDGEWIDLAYHSAYDSPARLDRTRIDELGRLVVALVAEPPPPHDGDGFWLPLAANTVIPRWTLVAFDVVLVLLALAGLAAIVGPRDRPGAGLVAALGCYAAAIAVATVVERPADAASSLGRRMVVWPDRIAGSLGSARLDAAVTDDARGLLAAGHTSVLRLGPDGERRLDSLAVLVESMAPAPRMLVFGAIDFAAAVARVGSFLGYHVTVCDARPVFATNTRFPEADEVIVDWPHRYLKAEVEAGRIDQRTVITVLTHDPKFDVPLLEVALRLPEVAYIGAMGSRRTHDDRTARLREAGLTDDEIARLSSPIGLDLGARTPEETAVSIAAEIIAGRWGGSGERLGTTEGRIHH